MIKDEVRKAAKDESKSPDEAEIRRREQTAPAIASWKHALRTARFTRVEYGRLWDAYRSSLREEPEQIAAINRLLQIEIESVKRTVAISEHQATRQLFVEKFDSLQDRITELESSLNQATADLAKSRELQEVARSLAEQVRLEGERTTSKLEARIRDLQAYIQKFSPGKRYFRTTLAFFGLFWFSEIIYALFGTEIIRPFWGIVGLIITTCMLTVIYFGKRESDSEKPKNKAK